MENKSHALIAGIFLLAVTAMLIALTLWLGSDRKAVRVYELSTREAVNGLNLEAAVRYRGINIGKVTRLGFDPKAKGNALLRITVDENAPITTSTFATLGFQGVTGLAYVQLDDDEGEDSKMIPDQSDGPPHIPIRQNLLSSISDQGTSTLSQVEETSRRINNLFRPENQAALMGAVTNLSQVAGDLAKLTVQLNRTVTDRLDPAFAEMPQLLSQGTKTLNSLQGTANEFSKIARQVNADNGLLDRLAKGGDALSQAAARLNNNTLPSTTRAVESVNQTARQADRALRGLTDNPQSLLRGTGAIRPGPGEPGFASP